MADLSRLSFDVGEASFSDGALKVGLAGIGRVGSAFARALTARGHQIAAVAASTPASSRRAAGALGARADSPEGLAGVAGLVVIAVPDDALAATVAEVARGCTPGTWVVHTSGLFGAGVLRACGERVAAVHPAAPVTPASSLDGTAFGVTCSDDAWPFARWLTAELGGYSVRIPEEKRALYHAALVVASNFTTALAADAIDLAGRDVVLPLLRATIGNLERMPAGDALTGPVVRGDAGTVRAHLEAIDAHAPHLRESYVAASRRLVAHARAAGRLDDEAASNIEEALR